MPLFCLVSEQQVRSVVKVQLVKMQLMEVQLVKMQLMEVQLLWLVLCSAAPLRAVGEIVDLKYNIADLKQFGIE